MQKINKNLFCIGVITMIVGTSTCGYASTEVHLPSDTPLSEQHIDKVEPVQQHYDVSLSMLRNLIIRENIFSNEDSMLIPDNSKRPENSIPQEALLANSLDPDYLFLWHDSQRERQSG